MTLNFTASNQISPYLPYKQNTSDQTEYCKILDKQQNCKCYYCKFLMKICTDCDVVYRKNNHLLLLSTGNLSCNLNLFTCSSFLSRIWSRALPSYCIFLSRGWDCWLSFIFSVYCTSWVAQMKLVLASHRLTFNSGVNCTAILNQLNTWTGVN